MNKKFEITEEQAQAILNYIAAIPTGEISYGEANRVVQILTALKEIKDGRK